MPVDFESLIADLDPQTRREMAESEIDANTHAHIVALLERALAELDDELAADALPFLIESTSAFVSAKRPGLTSTGTCVFMLTMWFAMFHEAVRHSVSLGVYQFDDAGNVDMSGPKPMEETPRHLTRAVTASVISEMLRRWMGSGGPFHMRPDRSGYGFGPESDGET